MLYILISLTGPPTLELTYQGENMLYTQSNERVDIEILTTNISLLSNLQGKWQKDESVLNSNNPFQIAIFTKNKAGLYKFLVNDWQGNDVTAIMLEMSAIGSITTVFSVTQPVYITCIVFLVGEKLAELKLTGKYSLLPGNEVFYTTKALVCVTSGTSQPQWSYKAVQTDTYIIQSSTSWNSTTGISTITITTTQQGYYTCTAGEVMYTVGIFNLDVTVGE